MPNVEVHIFEDAAGGLRVWPPFVFLKRGAGAGGAGGDTLEWKNHTGNVLTVELPPDVLDLATPPNIPAAAAGKPKNPGTMGNRPLDADAQPGTYKYDVTYINAAGNTIHARGSECGVD